MENSNEIIDNKKEDSPDDNQKVKNSYSNKRKIVTGIMGGLVIIVGVLGIVLTKDLRFYNSALDKLEAKNYEMAAMAFKELGNYKDSKIRYQDCIYEQAKKSFEEKSIKVQLNS